MIRSVGTASAALAIACTFSTAGLGQSSVASLGQSSVAPISSFGDIAGKWTGYANRYPVTLEIDPSGRFNARYALGGERGTARLEGGNLVLPLPKHSGTLQLAREGETLKGPGVLAGKTWNVSLRRSGS